MSSRRPRTTAKLAATLVLAGIAGCHRRDSTSQPMPTAASSGASAAHVPLDRLLPGELSASSQLVFGFPVPNGMKIDRAFPDAAHLVGEVTVGGLTDYIRKHAQVGSAELTGATLRFDKARIPNQGSEHVYRFEVTQHGRRVQLLVADVTPPPVQPGLSDEERWRQAGLKPNGEPLDISNLR